MLAAVRGGDAAAFAELVEHYRRELQIHCYRMVGSFHESEDLVQEVFLRAWRRRETFQGRATVRAWLYRIATNACLDFLDRNRRRPRPYEPRDAMHGAEVPSAVPWLEPYPDRLLDVAAPPGDEPEIMAVERETIELAFLVAIQHLPPRQRAVLILRDVLDWPASDVAALLDGSVASVKSALQRARATLREHLPERRDEWMAPDDPTGQERALLRRYVEAHERGSATTVAELLAEEVRLTMPPYPEWFAGRDVVVALHAEVFDPGSAHFHGDWRSVATRANRQPAVAHYCERPSTDVTRGLDGRFKAQVLDVLRVEDGVVVEITAFEPSVFPAFDLPLTLA